MAAATSAIIALGGLGLSAAQMVKADKEKKAATTAAKVAASALKNTKQVNAFESLQAPDIASLAQQANRQTQAQSVQALQGMGAEGAAQVANVGQMARASDLKAAEDQAKLVFQRDTMQAQAEQGINQQQYQAEMGLETARLEGAQGAAAQADANKNAAIQGMFGSASQAITGAGEAIPLYKKQKDLSVAPAAPIGTTVGKDAQGNEMSYAPGQNPNEVNTWETWNPVSAF